MKQYVMSALWSVCALFGMLGLSACSDSEVVEPSPGYNPQTNSVTTNFVFNVSTGNTAASRMSPASTQALQSATFRGMEDTHIYTFQIGSAGQYLTDSTKQADRYLDLGQLLTQGEITQDLNRRVIELDLPVGTDAMLFYGKAPRSKDSYNYEEGKLETRFSSTPKEIRFETDAVLGDQAAVPGTSLSVKKLFTETRDLLATILTRIAKNGLHSETAGDNEGNGQTRDLTYRFWWPSGVSAADSITYLSARTFTKNVNGVDVTYHYYAGTQEWSDYGQKFEEDRTTMVPLEEILGDAYVTFTTIKTGERRAGSGSAIRRTVQDLWHVTDQVANAEPTSAREKIAQLLGKRISTRFGTYFNGSSNATSYKDMVNMVNQVCTYTTKTLGDYQTILDYADRLTEGERARYFLEFPGNLDLPMGSTTLTFSGTNRTFAYSDEPASAGTIGGAASGQSVFSTYHFPPELMYFGNSPLRVTNTVYTVNQYPETDTQWDNEATWTADWQIGRVLSSTRSVAMKNDINYGTALLKSTVGYGGNTQLEDNNKNVNSTATVTEQNKIINITRDGMFQLTGILVGGQASTVGWDYLPLPGVSFDKFIYDHDIPSGSVNVPMEGNSNANYTLVWDNYNRRLKGDGQTPVYIALELRNNTGDDFWGRENLIRDGGTFYIIGKLDPKAADGQSLPESKYHALPPYGLGEDKVYGTAARRVFIQDYMTTANFIIGPQSLQSAYVTVPDLRSAQLSLGLSVDITWETGLSFDVILGGLTEE